MYKETVRHVKRPRWSETSTMNNVFNLKSALFNLLLFFHGDCHNFLQAGEENIKAVGFATAINNKARAWVINAFETRQVDSHICILVVQSVA